MRVLRKNFILLFTLSILNSLTAQEDNRILFQNNLSEITVDEFRDRYELMPHMNYSEHPDSAKKEFLFSLIAEKLWAAEAMEIGIDSIMNVRNSLSALKKLFLKDELYKKEVSPRINITDNDIAKGLQRVKRNLNVSIAASNSSEIHSIYNAVQTGADFDSLMETMSGNYIRYYTSRITLGSLADEKVEDVVFSLNPGEISEPVFSNGNWLLIKLQSEINLPEESTPEHLRNKTFSLLKDRREKNIAGEFISKILGGRSINADKQLFTSFSEQLKKIITQRLGNNDITNIVLTESDLMLTLNQIDKITLNSALVNIDGSPASLSDFIFYLFYQKIKFPSFTETSFNSILSSALRNFIEDEVLSREAVKHGLDKLPTLKKDLLVWRDFYLSEIMMNRMSRNISVTELDIEQFLELSGKSEELLQVNIIEILTPDLSDIELILNELNNGEDFSNLVKVYNTREWTKKSNGEWGYFNVNAAGEIGRIASGMNPGEVFGPLKLPEGYSIFKLIDKRKVTIDSAGHNELNAELIRTQVGLKKLNDLINKETIGLADKYGININDQLLKELKLSGLNTFTYRLIGFGGKIAALPVTIPMFEWYDLYVKDRELP